MKIIALAAMTVDHLTSVLFPHYSLQPGVLVCHIIGRLAAPIFWFFIAEGYFHTQDRKRYGARLFAFGIPFLPFQTSVFNQTSVIWGLAWGLVALAVHEREGMGERTKSLLIFAITMIAFCADWSSITVLAIVWIGANRGNFNKQMLWVAVYAAVYGVFIHPVYGAIQLFTALAIPLLKGYNRKRGEWKGMKWFFYLYYPLHLVICGVIRIVLHGNAGVMVGG